ncbi:MAG TPA: S8 family serine peptidase, partial [bacterium]|nr:S8 family serine peptidase [bacterium]
QAVEATGASIEELHPQDATLIVRIQPGAALSQLAATPGITFIEPVAPPPTPDDTPSRSNHRSNVIDTDMPMGRHYNGQGVHVAMGDDGSVGPHIDYQGRLNNAPAAANNAGDHGDHCGGIIMGAGNLDPKAKGMAAGATLHVFNVYDAINRLNQTYAADSVRITSISYSQVCNGGYTSDSRSLDLKTRQYPSLIPVFSAGNAGQQSCSPVGSGWYNITGGYKSAKNVITVANLDYLDQLNTSSSRGPAADGRIKPDIAAVGTNVWSTISTNTAGNMYGFKTGTSMSCPAVSGTCAQLFHAYRSLHSGQDPANGLIKALLLNTAEDLGNPGPDFRFGYGRINAARAVRVLETNRWFEDSLDQGQTRTHTIAVPPGTQHLRVMVYWTDVEGSSSTTRPLVNNLDAVLTGSGGTAWHPWVLDPTPDPARLDAPAVRAVDSLNNMEQITLDNPASGSYTLTVEGTSVPFGMQRYFVVVELQDTDVTLTYPIGGEGFAPADRETIRWDAYGSLAPFDISYSIDNGT